MTRLTRLLLGPLVGFGLLLLGLVACRRRVAASSRTRAGFVHLAVHQAAQAAHVLLQLDAQRFAEAAQFVGNRVGSALVFVFALLVFVFLFGRFAAVDVGVAADGLAVRVQGLGQRLDVLAR